MPQEKKERIAMVYAVIDTNIFVSARISKNPTSSNSRTNDGDS